MRARILRLVLLAVIFHILTSCECGFSVPEVTIHMIGVGA